MVCFALYNFEANYVALLDDHLFDLFLLPRYI